MVFIPPEVVVFEDAGFGGVQRRFNYDVSNASLYRAYLPGEWQSRNWDQLISSIIVISGTWQFFSEFDYGGAHSYELKPGRYWYVEGPEVNIANDEISSFKIISNDPQSDSFTLPIIPEIVVFGATGFGGVQRHFNYDVSNARSYAAGVNPQSGLITTWDDAISSVIVISGTWQFFADYNYGLPQSNQVKPGTYSSMEKVNIANGTISSFKIIDVNPQGDGFVWL
jgi:hypothetical protein